MPESELNTDVLTTLKNIQGIGPIGAVKLHDTLINKKIIDEDKTYTESELRDILRIIPTKPELKINLPEEAIYDLKYNPIKHFTRTLVEEFEAQFAKFSREENMVYFIGGSYSREVATCNDIDILIVRNKMDIRTIIRDFNKFTSAHKKDMNFTEVISIGDNRITTYLRIKLNNETVYLRVDIFLCDKEDYVFRKTYIIGSGRFNLFMRGSAKRQGLLLNQYGLFKDKKKINIYSEDELFAMLKMDYIKYRDYKNRNI